MKNYFPIKNRVNKDAQNISIDLIIMIMPLKDSLCNCHLKFAPVRFEQHRKTPLMCVTHYSLRAHYCTDISIF